MTIAGHARGQELKILFIDIYTIGINDIASCTFNRLMTVEIQKNCSFSILFCHQTLQFVGLHAAANLESFE